MEEGVSAAKLAFEEGYEHFADSFDRAVDDKGRIVLPAGPQRDAFEGRAWLTPYRGCLALWTRRSFESSLRSIEEQEEEGTMPARSVEAWRRSAVMVTIDAQGRFGIPARLRDSHGIGVHGSKVTVDGQGDRLEIRAADRPDEAMPEVDTVVGMWKHR
jgi:DNA-binding transcriptional regulator/RsmH inhibitor MraZ